MYIFKNPKIGSEVFPHKDNTYLITTPKLTTIGFWFALDDANLQNGCLWGVPASQENKTEYFMYKNKEGNNVYYEGEKPNYDIKGGVPLEVKKGTIIMFDGNFVHYSAHNHSQQARNAFTLHFVETENVKWHERNWLQRYPQLPFEDFYKKVDQLKQLKDIN
ncbi:phytanoyl- dioxygenase, putative [Ichthyophthirius multifiliis]|uniref:Phytanoyl-dioxygenase, putative n=1 Tax=Ichthyophthirius multifiliis TaxID=5932 RepID=G0QQ39_ICHMU|nr:phytanoyl- dioxygenase, putative [Ichthyophthirius multifiliis]EGR32667.1 phytanoyl- dioxygenase, putative [Ichthyophthirius multifiliis]|eukprot:XP_004036653.1 phytanoyl- dioxygenase, putative [Ichthyophthirius multifiliis]